MVGKSIRNSPFGKRIRASNHDTDDEGPQRNRPRVNPIFGVANLSTPSLDSSRFSASDSDEPHSPERGRTRTKKLLEDGDRFIPTRDEGDIRTSYHLMDEGGPQTPSKASTSRLIPSESDALREQANSLFSSVLHTEVTPPTVRPTSPVRNPTLTTPTNPSTPTRKRLFTFNTPGSNPTTPKRRLDAPTDEAYSLSPVRAESRQLLESPRREVRSVCKTPYRVLDAPDLADDFYLNLVDWSSTNVLGVGLGSCVYLWTAHTAAVSKLCDLSGYQDTVSSLSWVQKGSTLAVGTLNGRLLIYDANTLKLERTYQQAHTQRIGALAWNQNILSSGSRDRMVYHRDVREPTQKPFKRCAGHRQEVCGLRWSWEGGAQSAMLASGGNDNKVCIWDLRGSRRSGFVPGQTSGPGSAMPTSGRMTPTVPGTGSGILSSGIPSTSNNILTGANGGLIAGGATSGAEADEGPGDLPLWKFHEHTAAVKALAWDPHMSGVLATGGGTQDKTIRFWNVSNGTMLQDLDTGSQVCNLIWSLTSHELVSTHGFSSTTAQNQICIWKYPTLNMVASLTGHTHRVLYLAMSPDGETIVTGAGDETLRFWNAFSKKEDKESKRESKLDFGKLIR